MNIAIVQSSNVTKLDSRIKRYTTYRRIWNSTFQHLAYAFYEYICEFFLLDRLCFQNYCLRCISTELLLWKVTRRNWSASTTLGSKCGRCFCVRERERESKSVCVFLCLLSNLWPGICKHIRASATLCQSGLSANDWADFDTVSWFTASVNVAFVGYNECSRSVGHSRCLSGCIFRGTSTR